MIVTWLGHVAAGTPGVRLMVEATIFITADSEVQPDAFLFYDPPRQAGDARLTEDDYVEGAPQLVVEVAASSASYDLHDKKEVYRRAGVPEYIVWRVLDRRIDWFRLRDGEYVRIEPDARGTIESTAFPGLRLAVEKMLAGDLAGVLTEMGSG